MLYDWTPERYRRRQPSCWDPPWTHRTTAYQQSSSYELDMYSPSPPRRRPTCWDPPHSRDPPAVRPYDQLSSRYRREPYGSTHPHRMGSVQTRRPTCWDPPRHRTDNGYPPPYRDPDMVPDSYVEPRNSYARYRPWQPQYHSRPATKVEDPIGRPSDEGYNDDSIDNKLDRLMDGLDKLDAWREETDRRFENLEPAIQHKYRPARQSYCWDKSRARTPMSSLTDEVSESTYYSNNDWYFDDCEESTSDSDGYDEDFDDGYSRQPYHQLHSRMPQRSPSLRSDLPLKQPRTTSTIELPPDAVPRLCQPLLPLTVKAPLSTSTRQMQADVSSSRKTELETDLHECAAKMEGKLSVLNNVCNQKEIEKENDFTATREEEVNNTFLKTEKGLQVEALEASLETNERDLSMLPEKQSRIEKMVIQSLVDENTDEFEMKKHDNRLEMKEKQRVFVHERKWKTEELGMMNPKLLSLDADARLIPPQMDRRCLSIRACVDKILVSALNYHELALMIFYGDNEGRCSIAQCAFDPGGGVSPEFLLSTVVVASWFPP